MSLIIPKKEILYAPMLGTLGGGSARGFGRGGSEGGLYAFSSFTFEGMSGEEEFRGWTYSDALTYYQNSYPSETWISDTSFWNIQTRGYQLWTVPKTATYEFDVRGASGGYASYQQASPYRGYGGRVVARFNLTEGDVITIACGHRGHGSTYNHQASGGGGTFVVKDGGNYSSALFSQIMLIAGGGGGGFGGNNANANDSHGGNTGTSGDGGSSQSENRQTSAGQGGNGGRLTDGGGGFGANGGQTGTADNAGNHGYYGYGYKQGLNGGAGNTTPDNHACTGNSLGTLYGGFGGGSGGSYAANGAGGGYTGGSGSDGCGQGGGGGGGSHINTSHTDYDSGTLYSGGFNTSHGKVIVTKV